MQRRFVPFLVVLALIVAPFLGAPSGAARADDVPDDVRAAYEKAATLYAGGDLKKAYSAISKAKAKKPLSTDFWLLYVRIWRDLDKSEDVLWEKVIGRVEKANPASPVFDMLRYRLAPDGEARVACLEAAIAKDPKGPSFRMLLAREHLANGDDDLTEELLEAVLEDDPANEAALVLKGDLDIESGFSRSAVDFAEEALAEHECPGLHDLAARALLKVAENDESVLTEAVKHGEAAVAGRPDPAFVLTLVNALDMSGRADDAVALLTRHYESGKSPLLAGRLGEMALRTGDYDKAAKGLAAAAPESRDAALGLCVCLSRLGRAKEARKAVAHLLRHDPEATQRAAQVELLLGNGAAARAHLEGAEGDTPRYLRAWAFAWEGRPAEVAKLVAEEAKTGSRVGEEWLLPLAQAYVFQKLGGKATAARKLVLEAGVAAAKAGVPGATIPEFEASLDAISHGLMMRLASYRRALDGSFFTPRQIFPIAPAVIDGDMAIGVGVVATSECARDTERTFPFNAKKVEGNIQITLEDNAAVWQAASAAFRKGCAAFTAGSFTEADAAFGEALEHEPTWGRAAVLRATAKVLGGGDLSEAATLAAGAVGVMPDDWDARTLGLLVRLAAGKDVAAEAKAVAECLESFAARRIEDL